MWISGYMPESTATGLLLLYAKDTELLIPTIKNRCMAMWKRHPCILSLAEVIPVNIGGGRERIILDYPRPINPIASTITISLLKCDPLLWQS